MHTAVRLVVLGSTTLGLTASAILAAPVANADPADTFVAAFDTTRRAVATSGIDIIVISTSNRARVLGNRPKGIPANTSVRMHYEANAQGDAYTSVRTVKGKKLLGAWGTNAAEGSWATLSTFYGGWPVPFAKSRGLRTTTSITKLSERMPALRLHASSLDLALAQLVSPIADTPFADEVGWDRRQLVELREPDGTVVINAPRGVGDGEAEDECTYGPYEIVIKAGLIRGAKWKRTCPDGEVSSYVGTVAYESQVDGSPAPRQTEPAAFALPGQPPLNSWQQIANAANATAATQFASVSVVNRRGMNDLNAGVIRGLDFLDELMRYGNVGMPQQMGGPVAGAAAFLINARLGQEYVLKTDLYEIDSLSVIVGADGIITSITTVTDDPPDNYVSTFTR